MPFYIRKSVSVGPFRFNLSKSGIGLSAGVKGFRVGAGPRGNYIHVGRGGLYYRASLGSSRQTLRPRPVPLEDGTADREIETGNVDEMAAASSHEILAEINRKAGLLLIWPFFLGFAAFGIWVLSKQPIDPGYVIAACIITAVVTIYLFRHDRVRKAAVVLYDLDAEAESAFRNLTEQFDRLGSSARKWCIVSEEDVLDRKRNAGAGQTIKRVAAALIYRAPPNVRTNVSTPCILGGKQTIYFFPDIVLVSQGHKYGSIAYKELHIEIGRERFIESESVPSDTEVIGQTWRYVNKSGGPDRRFTNNREIPVVRYQSLALRSPSGLSKLIYLSREDVRSSLLAAISKLSSITDKLVTAAPSIEPATTRAGTAAVPALPTVEKRRGWPLLVPVTISAALVVVAFVVEQSDIDGLVRLIDGPRPGAEGTGTAAPIVQPTEAKEIAPPRGVKPEEPAGPATPQMIAQAQDLLRKLGFDAGPADGIAGPRTERAIRAFQAKEGLAQTGVVTQGLVDRLLARAATTPGK
jgi:hypothetical protein